MPITTEHVTRTLTTAERIRNNGVLILGALASVIVIIGNALADVDFTSLQTLWASAPTLLAAVARAQAYGPVTVRKMIDG